MAINFIKNGEKIKGQEKTITPSTSQQTITPDTDEGYNALTSVTVNAVDNTIDSNIQASNIKKDVSILGVTGTLEEALEINPNNTFADDTAKEFYDIQSAYDEMEPRVLTNDDSTLSGTISKNLYCIPTKSDGTPLLETNNVTIMGYMFNGCNNLKFVPKLNTSKATNMNNMFSRCHNLITVSELDTKKATTMGAMFYDCYALINVPIFDMSSMISNNSMFTNCNALSDNSLNNILASLSTAISYNDTKTLKSIGLSEEQATKCTTLSNWAACETAGWTTGY